jgi:hypothetical protein
MTLHLAEVSKAVKLTAHGVVLLDQAGWHGSKSPSGKFMKDSNTG